MITKNNTRTITGAKAIIDTLNDFGVEKVFGYPGGIVLKLYDELYKQNNIKHILFRHEQSAVHAAEGYARATGKCGVVLVTSGPGATNTVTGITNAYLDGYPLIVLTGQVSKDLIGKDAFQEADICKITQACTKKVFQITDANNIQSTLSEAFNLAMSGKKGPVVIDLAKNIFTENINDYSKIQNTEFNHTTPTEKNDIERILFRILNSQRPVIVSGGGVIHSKAEKELNIFSQSLGGIPIVTTMMGLGSVKSEANFFGMIGIFGDKSANEIIKNSDLIISLGSRFNDRITCMFKDTNLSSKYIQIDINPKEISKMIKPLDYIVGDIKNCLNSMINIVGNSNNTKFSEWNKEAQKYRSLNETVKKATNMLHSYEIIQKLDSFTKDKDVIFTSEVGQHQLWAAKNLTLNEDRKILLSGGSGTMGFGLPAAIGAAIGCPQKTVVCITGDGSFQMSLHELATCKDQNLNIKIIILNNGYLGMVRQLQQKNCEGRYYETKISNPDFIKLAESYGIKALKVNSINEIEKAFEQAFSTKETYIINFEIEPMEVL